MDIDTEDRAGSISSPGQAYLCVPLPHPWQKAVKHKHGGCPLLPSYPHRQVLGSTAHHWQNETLNLHPRHTHHPSASQRHQAHFLLRTFVWALSSPWTIITLHPSAMEALSDTLSYKLGASAVQFNSAPYVSFRALITFFPCDLCMQLFNVLLDCKHHEDKTDIQSGFVE